MLAIFLDGESKSGKTAVGRSIRKTLEEHGYSVRLIVAGHFFRFLTKLVLDHMSIDTQEIDDSLIQKVLDSPDLYGEMPEAGALNTRQIDKWVSRVGQRSFVQEAANGWREKVAQKALEDGIQIVLLDGRNLRDKLGAWAGQAEVPTALELIIACRPEVAAARYLGRNHPTAERLAAATKEIAERRDMDRKRAEAAYEDPGNVINLRPGADNVKHAVATAWAKGAANPPRAIRFDNSDVPLKTGLATATELAVESVSRLRSER
jgi:cytidylate kinase